MEALGDIKQLQHMQMRKAQAIDLKVNPPLQVPTAMKDHANARLPGGVSFYDAQDQAPACARPYKVDIDLQHLLLDIRTCASASTAVFYTDLFLMVADDQRSGVTATEIAAKNEEKLIQLGPVLERLQNELLKPLIDITFDRLVEARVPLVLNPPEELAGMDLDIEFVSTLAQAQRAVATSGMDRLLTTVANMAAVWPGPGTRSTRCRPWTSTATRTAWRRLSSCPTTRWRRSWPPSGNKWPRSKQPLPPRSWPTPPRPPAT